MNRNILLFQKIILFLAPKPRLRKKKREKKGKKRKKSHRCVQNQKKKLDHQPRRQLYNAASNHQPHHQLCCVPSNQRVMLSLRDKNQLLCLVRSVSMNSYFNTTVCGSSVIRSSAFWPMTKVKQTVRTNETYKNWLAVCTTRLNWLRLHDLLQFDENACNFTLLCPSLQSHPICLFLWRITFTAPVLIASFLLLPTRRRLVPPDT